ncbi:MAG: hypothetical protein E7354_01165 [Clostridiales bacterium]|nr:hypothetical protein [Clostridiales bacterium]
MCFKFLHKKKVNKEITYEEELFAQYGNCKQLDKHITILVFSDTHNSLTNENTNLDNIKELDYDVCLLLGDHSLEDIQTILTIVPKEKVYGIRGNHDTLDNLTYCGIDNIHSKVININGVKIGAIQGAIKYKDSTAPLYTQEESIEIAQYLQDIDILVSHDTYYTRDSQDVTHDGLKGITEAIYRNHSPIHIHGHLHIEDEQTLLNGTKSYGVYGMKIFRF